MSSSPDKLVDHLRELDGTGNGQAAREPVMTRELIRSQCRKHGGYSTEELNEKLFLGHFGFRMIQNLEPYTGCRLLYLDHNAISSLSPLAALTSLVALYAANNNIGSCTTLPHLPALETLDVSHNGLCDLKGIAAAAPNLETLLATHNKIAAVTTEVLQGLPALTTLDLSHNRLADDEKALSALSHEPTRSTLRTLVLDGNDLQRRQRHYRKRWITHFPALRMLDAMPVFPEERLKAEAFSSGGAAAEQEAAAAIRQQEEAAQQEQFRFFGDFRAEPRGRRMMEGPRTAPTPYYDDQRLLPDLADDSDDDNEDVYIPQPITM